MRYECRVLTFCVGVAMLSKNACAQQHYNTCEVFQFLDNDSSYLEKIDVKEYSKGRLMKEFAVAGLQDNDIYIIWKQLKGKKVFKPGDTAKVKEMLRFDFVSSDYYYDKVGKLQCALHNDDDEGVHSHNYILYEYGEDAKLLQKYSFDVSHNLINGVLINYYTYDNKGRLVTDSSVDDHRLVLEYQWDDERRQLVRLAIDSVNRNLIAVPVNSVTNIRFLFDRQEDSLNRRTEVKQYHYFDGGYEAKSNISYAFDETQVGPVDSMYTNIKGRPVRLTTNYGNGLQLKKNYFYNSTGDLIRTESINITDGYTGRITRIFTYGTIQKKGGR